MAEKIRHSDIDDMPDVGGSNRDHDRRYFIRGIDGRHSEKLVSGNSKIKVTVSDTQPTNPIENDIWVDTTGSVPLVETAVSFNVGLYNPEDVYGWLMDCSDGAKTLYLQKASYIKWLNYQPLFIKKIDATANAVIITANGSETIDGASSIHLTNQYDVARIVNEGNAWHIIHMDPHFITANDVTIIDSDGTSADSVSDLQTILDGNTYNLSEVVGVPGMNVEVDFTGVIRINEVVIRGYYAGGVNHYIEIGLYNYTDTAWDIIHTMEDSINDNYQHFNIAIPDYTDYISSGAAKVRFYHPVTGNTAHDLYLDYVGIRGLS